MGKENKKYIILSEITKKPYIDEKRNALLFSLKDEAESFSKNNPHTIPIDLSKYDFLEICSYAHSAGAANVVLRRNKSNKSIRLEKDKLKKKYYNSSLSANISRYLHTGSKRYIRAFSDSVFIVPIKIKNHPNAGISYATARIKNQPYVFVAFTDLEEYKKWESLVPGWSPLEIDASGFKRIGSNHGFIINPCGKNIIITKNMMSMIKTKDDEEGDYR